MKTFHILLIILLLSLYNAEEECYSRVVPTKPSDCHTRTKSTEDQYRCCYIYEKYYVQEHFTESKHCQSVNQDYYNHIIGYKESRKGYWKSQGGVVEEFVYDCYSNYLYKSLLSLIVLLL